MNTSVFIPSFLLNDVGLSAEEKIGLSLVLEFLIIRCDGEESTSLFGEMSIAIGLAEEVIKDYIEHLQKLEIITCFRDRFNIGGDQTMYVGQFTREAYLKEIILLNEKSAAAIEATPIYMPNNNAE